MSCRTLRFHTDRFDHFPSASGAAREVPFGDDLAEWIRFQLQLAGWALSEPVSGRDGWHMECRRADGSHRVRVGHDPGTGWRVTFSRPNTLVSSVLGRLPAVDPELEQALQACILREPSIQNPQWLDSDAEGRTLLEAAQA